MLVKIVAIINLGASGRPHPEQNLHILLIASFYKVSTVLKKLANSLSDNLSCRFREDMKFSYIKAERRF